MNNKIVGAIIALAIALSVVGYGAYRYGASSQQNASTINQTGKPEVGKRILYWHDPMVQGQRFDKPGKSPYMDMPLVPVYADETAAGNGAIAIDPRVQQRLGVRVANVEKTNLATQVTAVGNIEFNERDVAVVQARAASYVERVYARTPFESVTAGQKLADVYVPEWVAAQEDYLAIARMQASNTESLRNAALQRMRLVGMTDEQIAAVSAAKTVAARLSLRAPMAGVITELNAREGMTVMSGAPLFRINGLNTVWMYAEVPEARLSEITTGTTVAADTTAYPSKRLAGRVLEVLPDVSLTTRTAKARIELQNVQHLLKPGMFVTVKFSIKPHAAVLTVPSEAVIATGTRSVVILAEDDGRFRPVSVETGSESADRTEIRSGLEEGQQVVVSAQFLIDSESSLKAAMGRMEDGPSPALRATSPTTGEVSPAPSPVVGEGGGEGHDRRAHQ